ncbi:biotin synthase [Aquabacterium sp. A7-Y]|uniref:biotin synthase n=1 Tax=Aquabacterium sp. A7-Y TaxID=1349605 RepID=UPI00223C9936|nr:biotin synthase [Aquabacterium sp. A7-Y]MCW7537421.1 biotin synthase [Aquabacterium sp. A7-Y]
MGERLAIVKRTPREVLDWWSVQGGSLALLREHYPAARVVAVEPGEAAAARAAEALRTPWWSPSRWRGPAHAAMTEAEAGEGAGAELLWANMMLHWAPDPPAQLARWQRALAVDGFLMFSCLGPDTLRELRTVYERHGWGPATPAFIDMHDLGDMLVHAGFADPVMDMEPLTLTWDSADALLQELRTLGRNTHPQRHPGLRTPRWKRALGQALQGGGGRIAMRFEIIYGHAFKAVPRARVADETRVSLADMRSMMRSGKPR